MQDNIPRMAKIKKTVYYWKCERCEHEWPPKGESEPKYCPNCKSPYWNKPRQNQKKR